MSRRVRESVIDTGRCSRARVETVFWGRSGRATRVTPRASRAESAVRISVDWLVGGFGVVGLLGGEPGPCEVAVEDAAGDAVAEDGGDGGGADPVRASLGVSGGVEDAACGYLGLVDRWNGLCLVGELGEHPAELRGVDGGHRYGGDADVAVVVA